MFYFWMIVSMMLPIVFTAACLGLMALWVQWTAFRPEVIERARLKNGPKDQEDAIAQMLASRREPARQPWESRLDYEMQRLRRRSLGH